MTARDTFNRLQAVEPADPPAFRETAAELEWRPNPGDDAEWKRLQVFHWPPRRDDLLGGAR